MSVRALSPADHPALLALNNEHATELSLLDGERLRALLAVAALAVCVGAAGQPDAFLLAFDERAPAQGPNHAWFLARYPSFLYVDRVCVAATARRRGLARTLYDEALATAAARAAAVVCCEVNIEPPNPGSDAFHAALGFREVGTTYLEDRDKTVRYLVRPVGP
jgi:predicted GNAT superfamily acetyltransferase